MPKRRIPADGHEGHGPLKKRPLRAVAGCDGSAARGGGREGHGSKKRTCGVDGYARSKKKAYGAEGYADTAVRGGVRKRHEAVDKACSFGRNQNHTLQAYLSNKLPSSAKSPLPMVPPAASAQPKRPLSGYNLFYRYKRIKVVEATAAAPRAGLSPDDEKSIVNGVLAAPPGLEGVRPDDPAWDLPPAALGEFRSSKIREAMAGRLFPNENARDRPHRRVHGMGFIEMSKVMRNLWTGSDGLTKKVFCELADAGRVLHRKRVAEYNMGQGMKARKAAGTATDVSPMEIGAMLNVPKKPGALAFVSSSPFARKKQVAIAAINPLRPTNLRHVNSYCNSNGPRAALGGVVVPTLFPGDGHNYSDSWLESLKPLKPLALGTPREQARAPTNFGANNGSLSIELLLSCIKANQDVNAELQQTLALNGAGVPWVPLIDPTSILTLLPGGSNLKGTSRLDCVPDNLWSQRAAMSNDEV